MTKEKRGEINKVIDKMAQKSLRTLCLGFRNITEKDE
jgi:hypothetical protein